MDEQAAVDPLARSSNAPAPLPAPRPSGRRRRRREGAPRTSAIPGPIPSFRLRWDAPLASGQVAASGTPGPSSWRTISRVSWSGFGFPSRLPARAPRPGSSLTRGDHYHRLDPDCWSTTEAASAFAWLTRPEKAGPRLAGRSIASFRSRASPLKHEVGDPASGEGTG